jgi:hypothetical protein
MASIGSTCPEHQRFGQQELTEKDISVHCDSARRMPSIYRFTCFLGHAVIKPADEHVTNLLTQAGCEVTMFDSRLDEGEILQQDIIGYEYGRLTEDELIAFGRIGLKELSEALQQELAG